MNTTGIEFCRTARGYAGKVGGELRWIIQKCPVGYREYWVHESTDRGFMRRHTAYTLEEAKNYVMTQELSKEAV